VDFLFF